tara:strand:+ start:215 stop:469 length:255 start_codon:yes stop_codon:yes gene_type:complete
MEYDNNNTGALFINETATEENRRPYMSGNAEVNGKKMRISAWKKVAEKSGKTFLRLKFEGMDSVSQYSAKNDDNTSSTSVDIPL